MTRTERIQALKRERPTPTSETSLRDAECDIPQQMAPLDDRTSLDK